MLLGEQVVHFPAQAPPYASTASSSSSTASASLVPVHRLCKWDEMILEEIRAPLDALAQAMQGLSSSQGIDIERVFNVGQRHIMQVGSASCC